jgi:hypothetical protein
MSHPGEPTSYHGPARMAHSPVYWIFVGWWLGPVKWIGRVLLWLVFFPAGIWRSYVHHKKTGAARERRGWKQSQ